MAHPIDISAKTLLKTALVVLTIWVAYLISDILIMIVFSVIITSAVDAWATKLQKIGLPRVIGVIGIYIVVILILAGVFYSVVPIFIHEISNLITSLPTYYNQVAEYLGISEIGVSTFSLEKIQEIFGIAGNGLFNAGGGAFSFFRDVFSGVAMVVVMFVLSFYLSLQEDGVRKFLQFVFPHEYESYVLDIWTRTKKKLGQWLQGQLLLGLIVGIMVFVGLSILGVPYALVWALLAAILELVPMAGPIIASIPAIAFGLSVSPVTGLLTFIFYIFIQQIENHLLVPTVMKKAVGLNPVVVIIAILVGAKLGGIVGMLLAVPAAAVFIQVLGDLGEQTKI